MKNILIVIVYILATLLTSCVQSKLIWGVHAFSRITVPGREVTDFNGIPIPMKRDTMHIIFIETSDTIMPEIDSAFINGVRYHSGVYEVAEMEYYIGATLDGETVKLKPAPGNHFWRVELMSAPQPLSTPLHKNKRVFIKGRIGKAPFAYTSDKEIELTPEIRG